MSRSELWGWNGKVVVRRPSYTQRALQERREFNRNSLRVKNGSEYLIALEIEAQERNITVKQLIKKLLVVIARDDLVDAVLDDAA